MHKINFENIPKAITNYFYYNMERGELGRETRRPSPRILYKSNKLKHSFIYRGCYMYNLLPHVFRTYNRKKFAKEAKIFIRNNFDIKRLPDISDTV